MKTLTLYLFSLLWGPPNLPASEYALLPYENTFVFITEDSIYSSRNGDDFVSRAHNFGIEMYRMVDVPDVQKNPRRVYLTSAGGGLVYKFQNDTLTRVDQSYRWMSRFGDAKISFKDSILNYGGYGEYTYNNSLIFFSEEFREWGVIPINKPEPPDLVDALIQWDTLSNNLYLGFGTKDYFLNRKEVKNTSAALFRLDLNTLSYNPVGSFKSIIDLLNKQESLSTYRRFNKYKLPMIYGKFGIWTFDLKRQKAYHHKNADIHRLTQYDEILLFNKVTDQFLMANERQTSSAIFHVVNAVDLLGLEYEEYDLSLSEGLPGWAYVLIGASLFLLIPLFRTRTFVGLDQAIIKEERKIQQQLSSEDFFILKRIVEAFPEYVEYPELQNSYEKDLSYESRIKKLRASIKEIDEVVQKTIGRKRSSIFEIEKGREDKRVKVIRIKDDSLTKTDFFGRLRRGSK